MKNEEMPSGEKINDTILETKIVLTKSGCESIMPKWMRKCPSCNKDIYYTTTPSFQRAENEHRKCKSCCKSGNLNGRYGKGHLICGENHPMYGRHHSSESKQIMSEKRKTYCSLYPDKNPSKRDDVNLKKSLLLCGKNNPMYGKCKEQNPFYNKKHSDETRRKMRVQAIKRIEKSCGLYDGLVPSVGNDEEKYFSELEKKNNWDGIFYGKNGKYRQYEIKHLGYFVDYYEPTHNIVVEYDEPRHYQNRNLRAKDVRRMKEIKDYLKCKFWRYDAYGQQLVEF
jgi:hypothetical protein